MAEKFKMAAKIMTKTNDKKTDKCSYLSTPHEETFVPVTGYKPLTSHFCSLLLIPRGGNKIKN